MFPRYLMNFDLNRASADHADFIVIGSGIAGMYCALNLCEYGRVAVISKDKFPDGNSLYAQGGIAAAVGQGDSPAIHLRDTLAAGAGFCNLKAVKVLTEQGPAHIRKLMEIGVAFDKKANSICLTREGAHSIPRILHAGGDATGKIICQVLAEKLANTANISVLENTMAVDLLFQEGRCAGVLVLSKENRPYPIYSRAVVLASGGIGQLYEKTTNPPGATGDGIAMAVRMGAGTIHMEFVQFHPTMLDHENLQGFLISEAVRGEGAVLRNDKGERFMPKYHALADLAPRDIVTRAIYYEMSRSFSKGHSPKVYLDATGFARGFFKKRFPTIYAACNQLGINPCSDMIPVTPGAHYLMGGIETDTWGRTSIKGLFACGEVACNGANGANRLASNSLLECLVFGYRTAKAASCQYEARTPKIKPLTLKYTGQNTARVTKAKLQEYDRQLKKSMQTNVGVIRDARGLNSQMKFLKRLFPLLLSELGSREGLELQNKIVVSYLITQGALTRKTSCGAHYRSDAQSSSQSSDKQGFYPN